MSAHFPLPSLPGWGRGLAAGALLAIILLAGTGCLFKGKAGANPPATAAVAAPAIEQYKVTAATTPFYLYGPQQANGPDETLKKEARVTMVKRAYGYSRVTTADGKTGYVGTEDVAQLSPDEIADENAAQLQFKMPSAEEQKRMSATGGYTIPPEAGNDERLPLADPTPTPKPSPSAPFHF